MERIELYTQELDEAAFKADPKTSDAVVRNIQIIGEASARLPSEFCQSHQSIEWRKIVGLRNRIVHEYFGVDLAIIWQIIECDLPEFKERLERILEDFK
jgi:hypothetical protein